MIHKVTAIIKHHRLDKAKSALLDLGLTGMTITEVKGHGRQGGHTETYRGAEYQVDFLPKMKVEVLVGSDDVDRVMEAIAKAVSTGKIGDGKIWASPVDRVMRIRTGEWGSEAL